MRRVADLGLLLLPTAIWASLVAIGGEVLVDVGPTTLACVTWAIGGVALLAWTFAELKASRALLSKDLPLIVFCAVTGVAAFQALWFGGLLLAPPMNVAVLTATLPVMITSLAPLVLKEELRTVQMLGVLLTLAGALWIAVSGDLRLLQAFSFGRGELLILLANLCMTAYTLALRKWTPRLSPLAFMTPLALLGALVLVPFSILEGGFAHGLEPFTAHWVVVAYIGIVAGAIAYVLWNRSVERNGASLTGSCLYAQPAFAIFFCWLLLHQSVVGYQWLGLSLICAGIVLVLLRPRVMTSRQPIGAG